MENELKNPERRVTFLASDNAATFSHDLKSEVKKATEDGFNIELFEQRTTPRGQYAGATYTVTIIWIKR